MGAVSSPPSPPSQHALSTESGLPDPSKVQTTSCCPASPAISSKMSLVFSLLMGTSIAAALVILAALYITKTNRTMPRLEKRKTSHVTEVLQVDMIDRRLRSTSLDHTSLEMDLEFARPSLRADDVLQPLPVTKIQ